MNEIKLEKIIGIDYWCDDDLNQDVIVSYGGKWRIDKKRVVLQGYLEKLRSKVVSYELDGEKKEKLKDFYKYCQQKASILEQTKAAHLQKLPVNFTLKDKSYFDTDAEGNLYASDDM